MCQQICLYYSRLMDTLFKVGNPIDLLNQSCIIAHLCHLHHFAITNRTAGDILGANLWTSLTISLHRFPKSMDIPRHLNYFARLLSRKYHNGSSV